MLLLLLLGIKDRGNCEICGVKIEFVIFLLLLVLTYCFLFFCSSNLFIKKLLSYFNSYNLCINC